MWAGVRWVIIGTALASLCACSGLRVAYSTGPQLAWWWLDGYLDFPRSAAGPAREALDRWFAWHRGTQLLPTANLLAAAQPAVLGPHTATSTCDWLAQARTRVLEPAYERALQHAAELAPTLSDAQLASLEQRYAKELAKLRDTHLQPDAAQRREAAYKRTVERVEQVYGEVNEVQLRVLTEGLATSPFDPQAWLQERQRRQRDTLATLRQMQRQKDAPLEPRMLALRGLMERADRSPNPAYRAYQIRLLDHNCALAARLHNAATPAQRQALKDKLQGWEGDLRAIAAEPLTAGAGTSAWSPN